LGARRSKTGRRRRSPGAILNTRVYRRNIRAAGILNIQKTAKKGCGAKCFGSVE